MLTLDSVQLSNITRQRYAARMRTYLNSAYEESCNVPNADLENVILSLTDKASLYGITAESDLAAYMSGAWLMGENFDQQFGTIQTLLKDEHLSGAEKAEGIWQFIDQSFNALAGKEMD